MSDSSSEGGSGGTVGGGTEGSDSDNSIDYSSGGVFSWISQGFVNVVNAISSILNYINPISDKFILKPVIEGVLNILDYLNPLSDNFILKLVISAIGTIIDYLNPFSENFIIKHLIEMLWDMLVSLFVPSEESFTAVGDVFEERLAFIDTIKEAVVGLSSIIFDDVVPSNFLSYSVDTSLYKGDIVISFAWFEKFKPYTDVVFTGFAYLFFVWRLYKRLPSIINGVSHSN